MTDPDDDCRRLGRILCFVPAFQADRMTRNIVALLFLLALSGCAVMASTCEHGQKTGCHQSW